MYQPALESCKLAGYPLHDLPELSKWTSELELELDKEDALNQPTEALNRPTEAQNRSPSQIETTLLSSSITSISDNFACMSDDVLNKLRDPSEPF